MSDQGEQHRVESGGAGPAGVDPHLREAVTPGPVSGTEVQAAEREALLRPRPARRLSPVEELLEIVLIALLIALAIRHFVVETFVVHGASMEPTLFTGERLLVNKLVYRFREPRPGEIIVFRYPINPRQDFIKRVVAVAGDTVEIVNGVVYVNGKALDEPYVVHRDGGTYEARVVPPNSVWVLGDNRANSDDSRFFAEVPLKNIKGRAFLRFWPPGRWRIFPASPAPGDITQPAG